jgi:hypothetical protein
MFYFYFCPNSSYIKICYVSFVTHISTETLHQPGLTIGYSAVGLTVSLVWQFFPRKLYCSHELLFAKISFRVSLVS